LLIIPILQILIYIFFPKKYIELRVKTTKTQ